MKRPYLILVVLLLVGCNWSLNPWQQPEVYYGPVPSYARVDMKSGSVRLFVHASLDSLVWRDGPNGTALPLTYTRTDSVLTVRIYLNADCSDLYVLRGVTYADDTRMTWTGAVSILAFPNPVVVGTFFGTLYH